MSAEGTSEKKQKKKSSTIDILTILGLIFCFALMFFGIIFKTPPKDNYKDTQPESMSNEEWAENRAAYEEKMLTWEANNGYWQIQNIESFVDYPSLAITIGGCFAALMVAYPASIYKKFGTYVKICVKPNKYDPQDYIAVIIDFAKEARVKGLLSLEDKLNETDDAFLKSSLMLVVDSVEPEKVHDLLQAELDKLDERHGVGRQFMDSGAALAPGFGMIGTLIGLINMLKDLDDPSSLGPNMAVALLTTLYGSLLANVVFSPMANKLSIRHDEEYLCLELICQGVEAIQAGENPRFIEEKLNMLIVKQKVKGGKQKAVAADADDE